MSLSFIRLGASQINPIISSSLFCALTIGQEAGTEPPPSGKIVFGGSEHVKTVKVADCLPKVRKIIDAILKDLVRGTAAPGVEQTLSGL